MFYVVNKPIGISSNLVAKILKRVLDVSKIGFAGTLDPLATGLMIIGTGWSPRLFPLLDTLTKTYQTTIRLDGKTISHDLEHPVEKITISPEIIESLSLDYIAWIIQKHFTGDIMQSPPIYSAIWIDGERAYELARKWEKIEMIPKKRTIHEFKILSYNWPSLVCEITVSHGTYIRSIAHNLGEVLWTGGYLEKLDRTTIGHINLKGKEWLQHNDISYSPLTHEELFPEIPVLQLSEEEKSHLRLWSNPLITRECDGEYFVVYSDGAYGFLEAKNGYLFPLKNSV